ncbi:hypothetical protein Afe04nite_29000 [Asanoa ferruginea]|nr:hypothetical protein Afe04nite_29000 [Asanoa ferruginea]
MLVARPMLAQTPARYRPLYGRTSPYRVVNPPVAVVAPAPGGGGGGGPGGGAAASSAGRSPAVGSGVSVITSILAVRVPERPQERTLTPP